MYRNNLPRLVVVLAALGLAGCPGIGVPACDIGLVERIDVDRTMDHLRYLAEDIGPRVVSSPQERQAAEYIAGVLNGYGYAVEIQEFPRASVVAHLAAVQPADLELHVAAGRLRGVGAAAYPLLTPEGGLTARIVDSGEGGPDAFPAEVEGHIALVTRSDLPAEEVIANAAEAGAAAVIIHGNDWRRYMVTVPSAEIPFVTMNVEAADRIREAGNVVVNLQVNLYRTSQNVIATRPVRNRPDAPIVVFTAHYDTVEKAPGASDNASGTAGLLELARVFARVPVGVELRFAAVGGEEGGLVGSRYYVAQLPEEERARVVANYNMDMIGTAGERQTTLYVNTLDGDNLVAQSARIAVQDLGLPEELLRAPYHRGSSDHVPFYDAGIPAANFIWRDPETAALEPWYHHPHDTVENISEQRLETALGIVLAASLQMVCEDAPLRPELPGTQPDF